MLTITLEVNNEIILPMNYESVKEFYNIIEAKHKEKIVLSKI